MNSFLNWLDTVNSATIIGLFLLAVVGAIVERSARKRERQRTEEHYEQRMDAFRRSLEAAGDANAGLRRQLQVACEELGASQVRVESLAREKADLLQCNFELQRTVILRGEIIKYLSPYQAIRSTMPWGKN